MRMRLLRASLYRTAPLFSLTLFLSGCFAITDLDRFRNQCDGDTSMRRTFTASLRDMDMYSDGPITVRVVDVSNSSVYTSVAVAVLDGINLEVDQGDTGFAMPMAIPPGTNFDAQVFVDIARDGFRFGDDPGWSRDICTSGLFVFTRDGALVDVADPPVTGAPNDFRFRLLGFDAHSPGTQKLELMVIERESGRAVGYYRLPDVNFAEMEIIIPGIIELGRMYEVQFYVDFDQDDRYVAPPPEGMDHSWNRIYVPEDSATHEFMHLADFDPLTVF